jgi:hypothetical protein
LQGDTEDKAPDVITVGTSHYDISDILKFLPQFSKESDRGAVLLAVSYLDEIILRMLQGYCIDAKAGKALLIDSFPPLGSFAAKALAARALGLITATEFEGCETLRKIRNEFAHNMYVSLASPKIQTLCDRLKFCPDYPEGTVLSTRDRITGSAVGLIVRLRPKIDAAIHRRRILQKMNDVLA